MPTCWKKSSLSTTLFRCLHYKTVLVPTRKPSGTIHFRSVKMEEDGSSQSYPNWEVSQRSHQKIPKLSKLGNFFQANQSVWENPKYGNLWIRHPTNQPSSAKSLESCDDLPSVARCKMCHLDWEFAHPEIVSRLISNQQFWTEALAWHGHFSKKKHPGGSGVPGIHDFPSENRVNMNISQHHDYTNPTKR